MESVYDRLKDEIKLEIDQENYRVTEYSRLRQELKQNNNYLKISYETFFDLQLISKLLDWETCNSTHFVDFLKD